MTNVICNIAISLNEIIFMKVIKALIIKTNKISLSLRVLLNSSNNPYIRGTEKFNIFFILNKEL